MNKKITQKETNPYPFSDSNKRYYTYDYYLKKTFGGKCLKLPVDAGFTCPNIDGRCGTGGCIYCSGRGSGDTALTSDVSVTAQLDYQKSKLSQKWKTDRYIAYFQAHTNTYAPPQVLRGKFEEALAYENIVGLNIATRADCIEPQTAKYLAEIAERTCLTVELGLQSVWDETAAFINRGHAFADFLDGFSRLREVSDKINICVHLIFGLPNEDDEMMMESVRQVARLRPEQVKIHLLHVIRGTALMRIYERGDYIPLEKERYVRLVADAIERLPPETVIARLTGDGTPEGLAAPEWSRKKVTVINDIDKTLFERKSCQGIFFAP